VTTDLGLLIDCDAVVELVTDYLEGCLDAATNERVEAHLALCEGCEIYLDQMRATLSAMGHVPLETLSEDAKTSLLSAFRTRSS
jgi:predicted anti-sigma-YlaC factor YlaD